MQSTIHYGGNYRFTADNHRGHITQFDSNAEDADNAAPTPMEVMMQTVAGCTGIDIVLVMKKKRKTIKDFKIEISSERRDEHPRIFTKMNLHYILDSPDATKADFKRAIELSQEKYCGASAVIKESGAEVNWTFELLPQTS
ncbi:MAG: hypothetical protein Kapaf2KO_21670 [Candidatus Kapaibacteriales bacterium]